MYDIVCKCVACASRSRVNVGGAPRALRPWAPETSGHCRHCLSINPNTLIFTVSVVTAHTRCKQYATTL